MKQARVAVLSLALGSMISCSSSSSYWGSWPDESFAYVPVQSVTQVPEVPAVPAVTDPALKPIANAADPSGVVEAYAQALATGANRTAAEVVYMHRMVELGIPEMAEKQAADLNQAQPANGLAWAVTSYDNARKGDTNTALSDIIKAVNAAPDNLFVLRTAGQLMAWYDHRADKTAIPVDLQNGVTVLKVRIAHKPEYVAAYQAAQDLYGNSAATQPASAANPTTSPEYGQTEPPVYPSGQVPVYPSPDGYTYEYYSTPEYWWYPSYQPYSYYGYWGGSTFLYIPSRRFHEHRFEYRKRGHREFERGDREQHEEQFYPGRVEHRRGDRTERRRVDRDRTERHDPQPQIIGPLPKQEHRARSSRSAAPAPSARRSDPTVVHFDPNAPSLANQGPKSAPVPETPSAGSQRERYNPPPRPAEPRREAPSPRAQLPSPGRIAPASRHESPSPQRESPSRRREPPAPRLEAPAPRRESPVPPREVPAPRANPLRRHESPAPPRDIPVAHHEAPSPRREAPAPRREAPVRRAEPAPRRESHSPRREAPEVRREAPAPRRESPAPRREAPARQANLSPRHESPAPRREAPEVRREAPVPRREAPTPRREAPAAREAPSRSHQSAPDRGHSAGNGRHHR